MAYNPKLGLKLAQLLAKRKGVTQKFMFGGVAYMLNGHMFVGIVKDDLMVRVGPDAHDRLVKAPHARTMDFTGRPMKGYIFVSPDGWKTSASLAKWVGHGEKFVLTLPAKKKK